MHKYVGQEPSGQLFNEISLDPQGKPHNPMVNAGAIMVTSLLKTGQCMADRYNFVRTFLFLVVLEFSGIQNHLQAVDSLKNAFSVV